MDLYIIFAAITYLERVTGMGSLNKREKKEAERAIQKRHVHKRIHVEPTK